MQNMQFYALIQNWVGVLKTWKLGYFQGCLARYKGLARSRCLWHRHIATSGTVLGPSKVLIVMH